MHEAEWLTRKARIDTRLRGCNPPWQIIPWQADLDTSKFAFHAVTEFPTYNGPADYALFVDGLLLGILEAKKFTVNPQNVLEQAKRYAAGAMDGPGNWPGQRAQASGEARALPPRPHLRRPTRPPRPHRRASREIVGAPPKQKGMTWEL